MWFTRLAGRNVVPVLATIVLFAYPKLIRNSINLIIVSAATSFNRRWNHPLGEISIGIAFFTFLLIVGYHGYKKISNTRQWKKMVAKNRGRAASNNVNNTECVAEETNPLISQMGIPSIIDFTAPRESLLYDD